MSLPKLVNSSQFIVHRWKKTVNCQLLASLRGRSGSTVNCSRGFSLIELLVVISIIGLLVGIGSVSWTNAQQKGRDARRKADLSAIQQALELFFQENGRYPIPDTNGQIRCDTGPFGAGITWGNPFTCGSTTYMQKLPSDLIFQSDLTRQYYYTGGGNSYTIYASLENTSDPEITAACTLINWNYCVNQP